MADADEAAVPGDGDAVVRLEAVAPPPPPFGDVQQVLRWIGFNREASNLIAEDLGESLTEIAALDKDDIKMSQKSFATRTVNRGKTIFGTRRMKYLFDLIDWAQDFDRVGIDPTIADLDGDSFLDALREARKRADMRESRKKNADSQKTEASPGPLTGVKVWSSWILKLFNYLSVIISIRGIPLLYVVRDSVEDLQGDGENEIDGEIDWEQRCIRQCLHTGHAFREDSRHVHQIVRSLCIGEESESWLKTTKRFQCGKRDVEALCAHYRGAGNSSRQISEGERLRDTLHYKSETAMPFESFLTKCNAMFQIFQDCKEEYTEQMKVRFLLDKTADAPLLQPLRASIQAQTFINPKLYTFVTAADSLAMVIPTKKRGRGLGALDSKGSGDTVDRSEIMKSGKIFTGHYDNPKQLHPEKWALVLKERNKKKGNGGKSKPNSWKGKYNEQQKDIKSIKATIAKLSRGRKDKSGDDADAEDDMSDSDDHAGNSFGGRGEKRKAKKAKK